MSSDSQFLLTPYISLSVYCNRFC